MSQDILNEEEIEALFHAVDQIARGEDPDPLPEFGVEKPQEVKVEEPVHEPIEIDDSMEVEELIAMDPPEVANAAYQEMLETPFISDFTDENENTEEVQTDVEKSSGDDELFALLDGMEDNSELQEISALLKMSDNNEKILDDNTMQSDVGNVAKDAESTVESPKEKKKRLKKEKKEQKKREKELKKNASAQNFADTDGTDVQDIAMIQDISFDNSSVHDIGLPEEQVANHDVLPPQTSKKALKKEKKSSGIKNLFHFLVEDEEEDVHEIDENELILRELDQEDKKQAKKKKDKKGKKATKGAATKDVATTGEEADVETIPEKKDGKPKKEKKIKEKKPKKEKTVEEIVKDKKLSKKGIVFISVFAATIFIIIFIVIEFISPMMMKKSAVSAFEHQDYMTYYEMMYGQKRNEKENQMFVHSRMILSMQRDMKAYEKYAAKGQKLEALDSLISVVFDYNDQYEEAVACGAVFELNKYYEEALTILETEYGLSEKAARSLADTSSDVDYTRHLTRIVNGETYEAEENTPIEDKGEESIPDSLPEEEEQPDTEFLP